MANTKTREQIWEEHSEKDGSWTDSALGAMTEYSNQQNAELLERVRELEEGMQPFLELAQEVIKCKGNSRGYLYGYNKATISIDNCRKLTQLLKNTNLCHI